MTVNIKLALVDDDFLWSLGYTVYNVDLTLDSDLNATATFDAPQWVTWIGGDTITISYFAKIEKEDQTTNNYELHEVPAYITIAISSYLISGITLSAEYSELDTSITFKAGITF